MIIGIDFGSSTTKIVVMEGMAIIDKYRIGRNDPYKEIIMKYDASVVSEIVITGTGASYIDGSILGIKTRKVKEFEAAARGGRYLAKLDKCIVTSIGTGTSFLYVNGNDLIHAGGTGIGGALLKALAGMRGITDIPRFLNLAQKGHLEKSDLLIKDISWDAIDNLSDDVTVANMAKINAESTDEDYAYGVCNLVFQNIGVMAALADNPYKTGKIVLLGSLTESAIAKHCLKRVEKLLGCDYIIPDDALYAVAVGAILS